LIVVADGQKHPSVESDQIIILKERCAHRKLAKNGRGAGWNDRIACI